ncbi:PTS N,N'-diacetylchitobiose transporter subunit IIA [Escherichia coli]|nr:PTS N,N'-diacetylchitobiose transporter subunit IIA [Escherichia coli]
MMDLDNIPDTQTEAEELEEVVMGLIINSGQARSLAYAALKQAKQGDFAAAKAMMDQSHIPDTQTEAEELEEVVMGLIINSGQARSLAYAALKQAKQGDFAAAKAMMDQSRMALNEAHLVQTKLIEGDAGEGKMKVSLVLVHAQDHLMTSMLARELITELIELHEKLKA